MNQTINQTINQTMNQTINQTIDTLIEMLVLRRIERAGIRGVSKTSDLWHRTVFFTINEQSNHHPLVEAILTMAQIIFDCDDWMKKRNPDQNQDRAIRTLEIWSDVGNNDLSSRALTCLSYFHNHLYNHNQSPLLETNMSFTLLQPVIRFYNIGKCWSSFMHVFNKTSQSDYSKQQMKDHAMNNQCRICSFCLGYLFVFADYLFPEIKGNDDEDIPLDWYQLSAEYGNPVAMESYAHHLNHLFGIQS